VAYRFPDDPTHIGVGPVRVGAGSGLTVNGAVPMLVPHSFVAETLIVYVPTVRDVMYPGELPDPVAGVPPGKDQIYVGVVRAKQLLFSMADGENELPRQIDAGTFVMDTLGVDLIVS